jgi:hypothetical protein
MLRHFIRLLERLDIRNAEMMKLFEWYWDEIEKLIVLLDRERASDLGTIRCEANEPDRLTLLVWRVEDWPISQLMRRQR